MLKKFLWRRFRKFDDLRDALLSPVKVPLHFLGSSHAIRKIGAGAFETSLSEGLQFEEFAVLCVQLARSSILLAYGSRVK